MISRQSGMIGGLVIRLLRVDAAVIEIDVWLVGCMDELMGFDGFKACNLEMWLWLQLWLVNMQPRRLVGDDDSNKSCFVILRNSQHQYLLYIYIFLVTNQPL